MITEKLSLSVTVSLAFLFFFRENGFARILFLSNSPFLRTLLSPKKEGEKRVCVNLAVDKHFLISL